MIIPGCQAIKGRKGENMKRKFNSQITNLIAIWTAVNPRTVPMPAIRLDLQTSRCCLFYLEGSVVTTRWSALEWKLFVFLFVLLLFFNVRNEQMQGNLPTLKKHCLPEIRGLWNAYGEICTSANIPEAWRIGSESLKKGGVLQNCVPSHFPSFMWWERTVVASQQRKGCVSIISEYQSNLRMKAAHIPGC